jgi:hypothetical protein
MGENVIHELQMRLDPIAHFPRVERAGMQANFNGFMFLKSMKI